MKLNTTDLLLVTIAVAVLAKVGYDESRPSPTSSPTPERVAASASPSAKTPGQAVTLRIGDRVPGFRLPGSISGQEFVYESRQPGSPERIPIFIALTATGCGDCVDRVDGLDREAYTLAKQAGAEVWNFLVYQAATGVPDFIVRHGPSADQIVADPDSKISVTTLGGSDSQCWILIDGQGLLAWRGPAKLDGFKAALAKL